MTVEIAQVLTLLYPVHDGISSRLELIIVILRCLLTAACGKSFFLFSFYFFLFAWPNELCIEIPVFPDMRMRKLKCFGTNNMSM